MKKLLVLILVVLASSAFIADEYKVKKATAEVEMIEGLLIFVDAKPVAPYTYIQTVDGRGALSMGDSQYTGVRDSLIKRAKKECPKDTDGLILTFVSGKKDKCDCIKFN